MKNKSLDHGLLLMLFFSCKRQKKFEINRYAFMSRIIYIYIYYIICTARETLSSLQTVTKRHADSGTKKFYAEQTHD